MNRNVLIAIIIAGVLALGVGIWGYNRIQGDTQAASGPIAAVPLSASDPAAAPKGTLRFQIVSEESKASFQLQEDLRGQRIDVIGSTNQVAGEIAVNPADLSSAKVGVIQINARTLQTDNERRNRAIKNFILETDANEFITFTPKSIEGLSGAGAANTPVTFKIAGDLTIRNVTLPVIFEATVKAESAQRVTGSALVVVNRNDFKLNIPSVPMVANVSEEVTLRIDFVARAAG